MDILPFKDWGFGLDQKPLLLAGPCGAESEEQVLKSCAGAADAGAHILRAGIWKPRTRPNSFEGAGKRALPWIKAAGKLTGLPVIIEVANSSHVEAALDYGIDLLWIGARTTVNPFTVQEIANSLAGVDIPVFVKNPVNPDLELWIGAIERLNLSGIKKIAAIHRGFSLPHSEPFRNRPKWEFPIELKRRIPGIEIICDPSHICGKRELLQSVSQNALDLGFDGLMIETHIDPDHALSDRDQQLTPENLKILLSNLIIRDATTDNPALINLLDVLREEIDRTDQDLFEILKKRMEIVSKIGQYKKENNLQILQMERWMEIFRTRKILGHEANLSERFTDGLLNALHVESIRKQNEVMNPLKDRSMKSIK